MPRFLDFDCAEISGIEEFHDFMAKALGFPSYYGRNQDAFWDCITEIVDDTVLSIRNLSKTKAELREELSDYIMLMHEYESNSKGVFQVKVID